MEKLILFFVVLSLSILRIDGQCNRIRSTINENNAVFRLNIMRATKLTITFFDPVNHVQASHARRPNNGDLSDDGKSYTIDGGFAQRNIEIHVQGKAKLKSLTTNGGFDCQVAPPTCAATSFGAKKCENMLRLRPASGGLIRRGLTIFSGNKFSPFGGILTVSLIIHFFY